LEKVLKKLLKNKKIYDIISTQKKRKGSIVWHRHQEPH
jgi:hypothetical protein